MKLWETFRSLCNDKKWHFYTQQQRLISFAIQYSAVNSMSFFPFPTDNFTFIFMISISHKFCLFLFSTPSEAKEIEEICI